MTFNIRYDTERDGDNRWSRRRGLVYDVFETYKPDVVGLQEALHHQLNALLTDLPNMKSIGVGRSDGQTRGEYSAILYRADHFTLKDSGTFWLSNTPDVPGSTSWGNRITRICTWARFIDIRNGQAFYIFNTHFDHQSQPARERSAELIIQRIAERTHSDPVILTGDFNAGETNPVVLTLLADETGLTDTFRTLHADATDVGTFNGFEGKTDGAKIDYVLTDDSFEILDAAIIRDNKAGRYPSDHFPVSATLRFVR
ncbi:MAG: endonuclease/exonuclease/phosphatase family protein [Phycisphaerales bacterium]|nr:endonuclease/exonuclease/phosphatase family protein [Phycisphaerales bacterium]